MIYRGKVWKFGDNTNTDVIMPGSIFFKSPNIDCEQLAKYCLQTLRPEWAASVKSGDMIVAGKNFGCGSSRPAPRLLKALGISAIMADSVARIFFRNCINIGLPVINCPGVSDIFAEEDMAEVDLASGKIENLSNYKSVTGESLPKNSPPYQILAAGGIDNYLINNLYAKK